MGSLFKLLCMGYLSYTLHSSMKETIFSKNISKNEKYINPSYTHILGFYVWNKGKIKIQEEFC